MRDYPQGGTISEAMAAKTVILTLGRLRLALRMHASWHLGKWCRTIQRAGSCGPWAPCSIAVCALHASVVHGRGEDGRPLFPTRIRIQGRLTGTSGMIQLDGWQRPGRARIVVVASSDISSSKSVWCHRLSADQYRPLVLQPSPDTYWVNIEKGNVVPV